MITKEYSSGLRKQAAALRAQADVLEKFAAGGALMPIGSALVKAAPQAHRSLSPAFLKLLLAGAIGTGAAAGAKKVYDSSAKKPTAAPGAKTPSAAPAEGDTGGNDDTDYSYPEKADSKVSPNLVTGGAAVAGGAAVGALANYLAPEKYKKLMTALGVIAGAGIAGAGAHYGQKALNA